MNICMCEEHSKMIKQSSKDELLVILEHQLGLIDEATRFINLLKDENSILPIILEQSTHEVISQMEKVRYNARLVFNFTEEELRNRLSTPDAECIFPGIPGYTTTIDQYGTIVRTKVIE
jgi:hypothetical protein